MFYCKIKYSHSFLCCMGKRVKQLIEGFLQTLENEKLLKKPSSKNSKKILRIGMKNHPYEEMANLVHVKFSSLRKQTPQGKSLITEDEMRSYAIHWSLCMTRGNLEQIKFFLLTLIDSKKIKIDDNPEYGTLLTRVFKKLTLSNCLKQQYYETFMVNFRNAISHNGIEINKKSISYYVDRQQTKKKRLTDKQIYHMLEDVNDIYQTFQDFIKTKLNI